MRMVGLLVRWVMNLPIGVAAARAVTEVMVKMVENLILI